MEKVLKRDFVALQQEYKIKEAIIDYSLNYQGNGYVFLKGIQEIGVGEMVVNGGFCPSFFLEYKDEFVNLVSLIHGCDGINQNMGMTFDLFDIYVDEILDEL